MRALASGDQRRDHRLRWSRSAARGGLGPAAESANPSGA